MVTPKISVSLKVNERLTESKFSYEELKIIFCHFFSGDKWFIEIQFRGKETGWIYYKGDFGKYYRFEKVVKRFVEEFIVKDRKATFKRINEIVKELTGQRPRWRDERQRA